LGTSDDERWQQVTTQRGKQRRKRELAISALLNASTLKAAAGVVGLSERTLKRWLRMPDFAAEYSEAKTALLQLATAKLRRQSGAAVDVLVDIAADEEASAGSRVIAASRILELAIKAHEIECVEARIAKLEESAREGTV
jgi:hypothetical protein